jgi:hypothetical protein
MASTLGPLRDVDDLVDAEVALPRARADGVRLVRGADVQGGAIGVAVDRHGGDPHLVERARDADCDLAAVGDQDFAEHGSPVTTTAQPPHRRASIASRIPRQKGQKSRMDATVGEGAQALCMSRMICQESGIRCGRSG